MLVALGLILLTFHILSGGKLIQPTNMVTMAVQAAGIAIIATGMVLVIVSRNIDLSVGSLVGLIAMSYALLDDRLAAEHPRASARTSPSVGHRPRRSASVLGARIGALQGFIIAYIGVPSFIVTLGGLLSIRGIVWYLSQGAAVAGLDPTFQLIGGGAQGSIGGTLTWIVGVVGCVAIVGLLHQQSPPAAALRLPAAADVGRGPARRGRLRRRARPRLRSPTPTSGRRVSPTQYASRTTASRRRPAACGSRPASRSRSSCSSA